MFRGRPVGVRQTALPSLQTLAERVVIQRIGGLVVSVGWVTKMVLLEPATAVAVAVAQLTIRVAAPEVLGQQASSS